MRLWKPLLERSSFSQHKCFSSAHLFSICGDSQNDLYVFLCYTFKQPAERLRSSGCVPLAVLMESESSTWAVGPPTNMWWWSHILPRQQNITQQRPPSMHPHCLLFHMCREKAVFLMWRLFCNLVVSWRSLCYYCVFLSCNQTSLATWSRQSDFTPVRLVLFNSFVLILKYFQFSRSLKFIKHPNEGCHQHLSPADPYCLHQDSLTVHIIVINK